MRLAVSLYADDVQVLVARLQPLVGKQAYAEVRLDRMPAALDLSPLHEVRQNLTLILTCMPQALGGGWSGSEEDRQQRLLNALAQLGGGGCVVDVPLGMAAPADWPAELPRLWSWHEAPGERADLEEVHARLSACCRPGDLIKMVGWAETQRDGQRLLPLYRLPGPPVIAFAQGPGSAASRLWALALGAPWTYVCWPGEPTAPGQWELPAVAPRSDWPATPLMGVLGAPVSHSQSPLLWRRAWQWWQWLQLSAAAPTPPSAQQPLYLPLEQDRLGADSELLSHHAFAAFSVTTPLKEAALQAADHASTEALAVGAANFLLRGEQGWSAHMTDGVGALDALHGAGLAADAPVLILGGGGAARAVAQAAQECGHRVTIALRRPQQAATWAGEIGLDPGAVVALADLDLPPLGAAFAVVQATPVGSVRCPGNLLQGHSLPTGSVVLEMNYDPADTELLRQARAAGATALGGHVLLVAQMVRQFELWSGVRPPRGPLQLALEASLQLPAPALALIGPRATGKTTLGRMLADFLGWDFVDADEELERLHQRRIADWIPQDEAGFRAAEAALLPDLLARRACVIALGGGVVEDQGSVEALARHPRVMGLTGSVKVLVNRQLGSGRPTLIEGTLEEEVRLLLRRRSGRYERACHGPLLCVDKGVTAVFLNLLGRLDQIACS